MATNTGAWDVHRDVLVWPMPIPNEVRALFTMVLMDIFGLIDYVSRILTKTDTFHLIIPLNCLGHLLKDPIYKFPQVIHIDVICDNIRDLRRIKSCFQYGFEKLKFCTINDIGRVWKKTVLDRILASSNSIDRSTINAIMSSIQNCISAKQLDISTRRSYIRKQCVSTSLHGFPVKDNTAFPSRYICPSCELVYRQPYQLECGHLQCNICVNIKTSCATCFKTVSLDKSSLNPILKMEMQDLHIHCLDCNWKRPLKDYEAHLNQNHDELITHFICNRQDDRHNKVISLNGACIWEVSDIENIKNNAVSGRQYSIYSDPFYLFPNGYKMCLRLYINGDRKAKGTHMSLFFVIMRGEYDDKLRWPFNFKATFSLIDQSVTNDHRHPISKSRWPGTTPECFERPNTDMNPGFGIPMFIPLTFLEENQTRYIQNNRMYIKTEIDFLAAKPRKLFTSEHKLGFGFALALPLIDGESELPNDEEHVDTTADDISALICSSGSFNHAQKPK